MASISRRFLTYNLIPKFGTRFETGNILNVGKHLDYDYSVCFPNCDYKSLDINPELKPDIVADIQDCGLPDKSYDGILANGMYECVKDWEKTKSELYRILKDNGYILLTYAGVGFFYGSTEPWEVFEKTKPFKVVEVYITYYKNGKVEYISLICKK